MSGINIELRTPRRITASVGAAASSERQVVFAARTDFPAAGRAGVLYIATDEGRSYYYDVTGGTYDCVGSDTADIKIINCELQEENSNG